MTIVRFVFVFFMAALVTLSASCSKTPDKNSQTDETTEFTDSQLIQFALNETATRWHYGDKAVLYDMEFDFYKKQYSYDDYLAHRFIKELEADSLESLIVLAVHPFGEDSILVDAEAVFVGPAGVKTRFSEGVSYQFYFHNGRWIHPTISSYKGQLEFEQIRRSADSAADAEAEFEDD